MFFMCDFLYELRKISLFFEKKWGMPAMPFVQKEDRSSYTDAARISYTCLLFL